MKRIFACLLCLVVSISAFAFSGCNSVFGGKYTEISAEKAVEISTGLKAVNLDDGGIKLNIDANVYGMKSKTFYEIVKKGTDLQMHGESDPMGIESTFYYTGGYVYARSALDGDVFRVKQKISLEEVIFGNTKYSNIDDRISMRVAFDPLYAVSTYAKDLDTKFYVLETETQTKIKVVFTSHEYYPQTDHTIDTTETFYYVYDKSGNFVAMKIGLNDVRVSRGYREKSKIVFETKLFDGEIELPPADDLAKYREEKPE